MRKAWTTIVKRWASGLAVALLVITPIGMARAQSGQDCDDNAVIRCGISASNLVQKYRENQGGNVQAVFREFGMPEEASLSGMVAGRVTNNNEVYVGDKLVARNALTAGRQNMPGSTPILGGQFYRRPPSVSLRTPSLSALVKMDGETFRYAIIESCGNPVTAEDIPNPVPPPPPPTPAPSKPDFSIQKDVRKKGDETWMQHIASKPGETVQFRITIKNTGETELKNIQLRDKVPAGLSNPKAIDTQHGAELFTTGVNLGSIAKGGQKDVVFEAVVNADAEYCGAERLRNVAYAKPEELPEENDDATVEVCKETPPTPPAPTPTPTPPAPTPPAPAPTVLPDTGAGAVMGIFSTTTFLGVALYRLKEFYLQKLLK